MAERNLDFDRIVDRRNTKSLKYDFAEKRGMPKDLLPLWVADMDFKTSSYVQDALAKQVEHGIFGYSDTLTPYFEIVRSWMKRHHDWDVEEDWLVKTPGIVFALAMAVRAFTEPGDAVLIQQPVYYPFSEVISVWTKEELTRMGEICQKYQVKVVSDEIHADFVFKGKHQVFAAISKEFADFTITCTSPSKTFNLAGLQISNIFISNPQIRETFKQEINRAGYSQLNVAGLVGCEAAYSDGEEWYEAMKAYVAANIEYTKEYVEQYLSGVSMTEHEGTYLVWLDFRGTGLGVEELEDLIIHKAKLWLDSGKIFGEKGKGFQRINVACPRATLTEALERIRKALEERK